MVVSIAYSNIRTDIVPMSISLPHLIEGAVISLANGYLVICILLTKKLRTQRNHIILVSIMLFEVLFGLDYFTSAAGREILKAQYEFFPVADSTWCFFSLHIQITILTIPLSGYLLLITSLDRLIAVYFPIHYRNLSIRYAYVFLVLPYLCTIPTFISSTLRATSTEQMAQNVSQFCVLRDAVGADGYKVLRGIRIFSSFLSTMIYIPIMIKIYNITKRDDSSSSIVAHIHKNMFKVTRTVALINANTLLLFTIPDTVLFLISNVSATPIAYVLTTMILNKGIVNLLIILFTQRTLWAEIFRKQIDSEMLLLSLISLCLFIPHSLSAPVSFRVMSFNIWLSGRSVENGLQKIAKHIMMLDPDIVALQEVEDFSVITNLTLMLGGRWEGMAHGDNDTYPDTGILTRHTFHPHSYTETNWTMGVKITLDSGYFINFWSAHLDYKSYGPYAAANRMVTSIDQIQAGEKPTKTSGRWHNMMEVKANDRMQKWIEKSSIIPIVFAGDFNCPSHLDWDDRSRQRHFNWSVEWPATKILTDMGFRDSFRQLYPDPNKYPGTTWSTVNKFNSEWDYSIPEPQDRIDFIFYKGNITPTKSFTYSGDEPLQPIPNHQQNDYPSDHFAMVTDFEINSP